ncbi:uncharacterized protein LOC134178354 [Corticium candelabrum]|uniref:uncharacterized protein LOC134178354 n=1 Tax=Corticium candelabrum TaxID=121492 RepID=UPI002E2545BA|nr:uncharacterized protein LOC134178354 [Corticium candelabrum]
MSEVVVTKYFGSKKSKSYKYVFICISGYNFVMWGHSIADAACRSDIDNAAIVGYQVWEFFDPVFGSAIVFFRILSGCLFISLAFHSNDSPEDENAEPQYDRFHTPINRNDEENIVGIIKFMTSNRNVRKQTLTIFNDPEATTTDLYFSAQTERFHRNTIRSYYGSVFVVLFAVVPFVTYDTLARHVGKPQDSKPKYAVELTINILLIVLNGWYIISCGWCPKKKKNGDNTMKSNTANYACNFCKNIKETWKKKFHFNAEFWIFLVFTVSAIIFNILLAKVEGGQDLATDITAIIAVILQSVFVFWTALVPSTLELTLLRRGHRHHSFSCLLLSLLFAITVGALAVDIEREHFGSTVHHYSFLRALAPLMVDFRVHAAILTYSVLSEFFQQRFTKREIKDKGIFEQVSGSLTEEPECFRTGCKRDDCKVFWKCTNNKCNSGAYCNKCFTNFIVKLGFCPTCSLKVDSDSCQTPPPLRPPSSSSQTSLLDDVGEVPHYGSGVI